MYQLKRIEKGRYALYYSGKVSYITKYESVWVSRSGIHKTLRDSIIYNLTGRSFNARTY